MIVILEKKKAALDREGDKEFVDRKIRNALVCLMGMDQNLRLAISNAIAFFKYAIKNKYVTLEDDEVTLNDAETAGNLAKLGFFADLEFNKDFLQIYNILKDL